MTRTRPIRAAALTAALALCPALAQAQQGWGNPALPRSPYALPEPTSREPDVDDLINGNGKLHFAGQWRHWGDSRNNGELVQMLLAPNQVLGASRRTPNGLPLGPSCNDYADRC